MASHGVPRTANKNLDKSEGARRKRQKQIDTYRQLVEAVQTKIQAKDYSAETLTLTSTLLSENPEYYTVWNDRRLILKDVFARELANGNAEIAKEQEVDESTQQRAASLGLTTAQHEILLLIQEDLAFLLPLLKNFPKCYWIWNHRAWLLQQASEHLPVASALRLWQGEMGLVTKMLGYDTRNFHGWSYRRRVVRSLEQLGTADPEHSSSSITEQEFAYTTKMVKMNLSNFSAWHNRLQLIPRLLAERGADGKARRKLLDEEFDFINQALYVDPYDQSLWFYHNYLMTNLSPSVPADLAIVQDLTDRERADYFEAQINLMKDILEASDDCKYIYQALLTNAAQYMELQPEAEGVTTREMQDWLARLEKLDPLRSGRWQDLRRTLKL